MNEDEIERFRKKLIALKSELQALEDENKQAGETVELDQTRVGRISRMDAMQVQQMALESERRRQQQLLAIEGALLRIDSDEYGYCFVCGEQIVVQRLEANPACTRCVGCTE